MNDRTGLSYAIFKVSTSQISIFHYLGIDLNWTPHKLFFCQQPLQRQKASEKSEKKFRTAASLQIARKFGSLTESDRAVDIKITIQKSHANFQEYSLVICSKEDASFRIP